MNEEQKALYLVVIQKQDYIIKEYQKALNQTQMGITIILVSCLVYLVISFAMSHNISRYASMFKNLFNLKKGNNNGKRNF